MEKQTKKPTNAQLQRRIDKALIHVDRTKDDKEVYFGDKGLRIIVNDEYAIIATNWHRHVFSNLTSSGYSRPWLYTKRFVEIALANDCLTEKDGYSYKKLFENLKAKEDKSEYNLCWFIDLWLFNIFAPLYSIGESESEAFLVYETYLHNIARNSVILSEKENDITNKQFVEKVIDNIKDFTKDMTESVIFKKLSDDEFVKKEIEAIQQNDMEEQINASQD